MTIQFVGHVESISSGGPAGTVVVKLRPSSVDTTGDVCTVFIERSRAHNWLPGRNVQFTIYTLPEPQIAEAP